MKSDEFVKKLKDIATNYKTLYVMGCFGSPLTIGNKQRMIKHHNYNAQTVRTKMINSATADTFGFDCVCLIKAVLWGWDGNKNHIYGGAGYAVNGVPDLNADAMFTKCTGRSTDFSSVEVGDALWTDGHIGIYIGDGLAVECTPKWDNCVQITAVGNIGGKVGYNIRTWKKHGKLPYITYIRKDTESMANFKNYTVKKGDNLWKIAVEQLGDGARYPEIVALNGITSQTVIHAGDVLKIPVSKPSKPVSESHYEKLGRAFEKAIKDIKNLESVKTLLDLAGE